MTGDWIGTFIGHKGAVWSSRLSSDATVAATGSADFTARIWDPQTGECQQILQHDHIVKATNGEGVRAATTLTAKDGIEVGAGEHTASIRSIVWNVDFNILTTAADDKTLRWYDLRSQRAIAQYKTERDITSCELSTNKFEDNDPGLLSVAAGHSAILFDAGRPGEVIKQMNFDHDIASVAVHPPTGRVVTGGMKDTWVRVWDLEPQKQIEVLKGHHGPIWSTMFSPDGKIFATGSEDGTIKLWKACKEPYGLWRVGQRAAGDSSPHGPDSARLKSPLQRMTQEHQHQQHFLAACPEARQHDAPSQKTAFPRWPQQGTEKSSIALACTWIVLHQISISVTLISLLFAVHALYEPAQHHTAKFFRISYYNAARGTFALGWDDIFFVFYWIIVFTGARCAVMDYFLSPLAAALGICKPKARVRFAEQAWIVLYSGSSCCVGLFIYAHSDYWLNLRALWWNWPTRELDGLVKWYYLVQFAFWLQQIVVVNIEERRKDYAQMFTHHIITCTLIFGSYGYHQTRVGNLILVLMDFVDVQLSFAKLLKYLGFQALCDAAFGAFMVGWFALRHVAYMCICWSVYVHIPQEITYGCYSGGDGHLQGPSEAPADWEHLTWPFRDPEGLICWNDRIKWAFLTMLLALQVVLLIWFGMIIKVAYKVVTGTGADDVRSDDEDESADLATDAPGRLHPSAAVGPGQWPEEDVLSTDAHFAPPTRTKSANGATSALARRKKENGHSSGVNILGGSTRKELLGRIGCDKPTSE
ncbi:hypothetical protein DV737_g2946, partial [Chaetothyriales sp. CBS 132003]